MKHKFKSGDKVMIVETGRGCAPETKGQIVTIDKLGYYTDELGYTIKETHLNTNSRNKIFDSMISEKSFTLVESFANIEEFQYFN